MLGIIKAKSVIKVGYPILVDNLVARIGISWSVNESEGIKIADV